MFIKKNLILNIYFDGNYVFTSHSGYFWTLQDNRVISNQFLHGVFLLKKILTIPKYFFILKYF
jgi:hypothetical protein